eukprot:scaffold586_cov112-Skeletonema_dohrnii-CCMP3373.AAC.10
MGSENCKVDDIYLGDIHTLVKFYRRRIPCSCLDERYEEVKSTTKMAACCNRECNFHNGQVERKKTMYCSGCRIAAYCSVGCQKADWSRHKLDCHSKAAIIAEFEAKRNILHYKHNNTY